MRKETKSGQKKKSERDQSSHHIRCLEFREVSIEVQYGPLHCPDENQWLVEPGEKERERGREGETLQLVESIGV